VIPASNLDDSAGAHDIPSQPRTMACPVTIRNSRDALAWDFGNLRTVYGDRYSVDARSQMRNIPVMRSLPDMFLSLRPHWWVALIVSALGIAATCIRALETDEARAKCAEGKKKKELRLLADKISGYGQGVHRRYPTGDVVVSERDLAEQLRKRPGAVATALDLLLREQKVQRAPLSGYWKLNV
jgi:hypothetical protein